MTTTFKNKIMVAGFCSDLRSSWGETVAKIYCSAKGGVDMN
jgi:hypothetical protein